MPGRSKETNAGNGVRRSYVAEKHLEREQNSDYLIISYEHIYIDTIELLIKIFKVLKLNLPKLIWRLLL